MNLASHEVWVERYRPQTVSQLILPEKTKATFQSYVDKEYVPNIILGGPAGIGKTSVAIAMCKELGADYLVINASLNSSLESLRSKLTDFASTVSMGGRKYIILDEFDNANRNHFQPALRGFIEDFSSNCSFILTANHPHKIIDALKSRCVFHDFTFQDEDKKPLAMQFMQVCKRILDENEIEYEDKAVAQIIFRSFPDWRKVINDLQSASSSGPITLASIAKQKSNIDALISSIKNKRFDQVRDWIAGNSIDNSNVIFREFYDRASELIVSDDIPQLVVILGEGQFKAAFSVDPEINLAAVMAEIMVSLRFK